MPVFKPKSGILAIATAGYDAAGRLAALSDGNNNSATYSYVANSPLVDHIAFTNSAGARAMTTSNTYDYLNCLTGKSSVLNFNYQYNAASQRTRVTLADGSYWVYGYDTLGQLTSGVKYFWDGTPYAGQQFGYAFDSIGNRTSTQAGGDQNGANLRQANYHYNVVNELTGRDVPGYVDVMGLTLATNTVQVNGANAYQKWEYFREQIATTNTNSAQWVGITVTAPGQATNSGCVFVPQTPEGSTYDLDGNLTKDGRWTYAWDGENRPISMTSLTNAPTASKYRPAFTYDYKGRRIQKIVSTNNGSGYVPQYTNLYLYDGWNLVTILDQSSSLVASFMWGTDLSGSMQGAGGVGGLLAENIVTNGAHFVAYDGNGNVAALVSATNGAVTANYEYGPFGELIRATGPMAKVNPFLFSTKFYDWETGLYYYGFRYYNPSTGRWLSRDPMEEKGGLNLYGCLGNNEVNSVDPDGCGAAIDGWYYWNDVAAGGIHDGGLGGSLRAAGGVAMMSFIDFWSTREIEQNASDAGTAAGQGHSCESRLYLMGVGAAIVLDAVPGAGKGAGMVEKKVITEVAEEEASALAKKVSDEGVSVWEQEAKKRGRDLHKILGQNLPPNYPTIDIFAEEKPIATSIKTLDPTAKSYQGAADLARKINGYVDKVKAFNGADYGGEEITEDMIKGRQLHLAIRKGVATGEQRAIIAEATTRAEGLGVTLIVTEVP